MNIKLIYVSPGGTTKGTTKVLKEIFEKNNHQVELIDIGIKQYRDDLATVLEKMQKADIVGFGSPTYHMDMLEPMKKLFDKMKAAHEKFKNEFSAFFYINYGGITSGKAFELTAEKFCKMGIPVIGAMKVTAPHFHHPKEFPSGEIYEIAEEFYLRIQEKKFAPIEWQRAKKIFAPEKKRVNILYPFVHMVGKKRELPISINKSVCKKCGKCSVECPGGAISMDSEVIINFSKCIHCYHCVVACMFKAIESPVEKIDDMIKINKKIMGEEKFTNQIYI